MRGLELLQQRVDKNTAAICLGLSKELARGCSLARAMEQGLQQGFFSPLVVNLVAAGEESGQLQKVLLQLSGHYAKQEEVRRFVLKAALYPLFLLGTAVTVLLFFILYVLPVLAAAYSNLGVRPTGFLTILLQLQELLMAYPLALPCVLVLGGALLGTVCRSKPLLLHLPVIGVCYKLVQEQRFCELLSLLLDSGLNITEAVAIVSTTLEPIYKEQLLLFNGRLQRGVDIGQATTGLGGLLSPMSLELMAVGAATGYLPQLLAEAGSLCQDDLQNKLERIKEFLGPILLLIGAAAIAAVVCAVIGPLFELLSAMPEY